MVDIQLFSGNSMELLNINSQITQLMGFIVGLGFFGLDSWEGPLWKGLGFLGAPWFECQTTNSNQHGNRYHSPPKKKKTHKTCCFSVSLHRIIRDRNSLPDILSKLLADLPCLIELMTFTLHRGLPSGRKKNKESDVFLLFFRRGMLCMLFFLFFLSIHTRLQKTMLITDFKKLGMCRSVTKWQNSSSMASYSKCFLHLPQIFSGSCTKSAEQQGWKQLYSAFHGSSRVQRLKVLFFRGNVWEFGGPNFHPIVSKFMKKG